MTKKRTKIGDEKPMKRNPSRASDAPVSKTSELQPMSPSTSPAVETTGHLPELVTEEKEEGLTKVFQAFRTSDLNLLLPLVQQTKYAACHGDPKDRMTHLYSIAAVQSLEARDGLETLLAVQMVGVHNLAMRCLADAADKEQIDVGVEVYLNRANRLLRTFTAQMEALKKYRSNGEQRCTVEHVHVYNGGQAVVGTINQRNERTDNRNDDLGPQGGNNHGGN